MDKTISGTPILDALHNDHGTSICSVTKRTYKLFPLEPISDDEDDCYGNPQGDYCDQFDLRFLKCFPNKIDVALKNGDTIDLHLTVIASDGRILKKGQAQPDSTNYLGEEFDRTFSDFLWANQDHEPLTVKVVLTVHRR